MKKQYIILLGLTFYVGILIIGQTITKRKISNEPEISFIRKGLPKITSDAQSLINTYKKLFSHDPKNCLSPNKILTSFGTMTCPNYSTHGKGLITFACFYIGLDSLRTIWGSDPVNFTSYGACPPSPILFPPGAGDNHIFVLKFVKTSDYRSAIHKDMAHLSGIPIKKIKSIDCIKMEEANGLIALSQPALYSDHYSSLGILAYLTLTDKTQVVCYIINNYDTSGTLKWKE